MSVKNRTFSAWSRDHHKTFAAAIAAELEKKADLDSPHFVGIPTAPTAEPGTKDNQIATTEFVADAVGDTSKTIYAVSKSGDTMSGKLIFDLPPKESSSVGVIYPIQMKGKFTETGNSNLVWQFGVSTISTTFYICHKGQHLFGFSPVLGFFWEASSKLTIGYKDRPWANVFTKKINNGTADIEVPSKGGTLALVSDIEDTLRKYNLIPEQETTEQN